MAEILDFAVNMSLIMSGNFNQQAMASNASLDRLRRKALELQRTYGQTTSFQKQSASLSQLAAKLSAARERTQQLALQTQASSNVNKKVQADYQAALAQQAKLEEAYQKQKSSLDTLGDALQKAGINSGNFAQKQSDLQNALSRTQDAQDRLSRAQEHYAGIRSQLDWGNIKGDLLSIAGTFSAIKAPVKIAGDFEAAMARVKSVGFIEEGSDMKQFEAMREQALQLGADTKFTSIEAANAQENLIRSGMSPKDVIAAMPAVLNMAAAEGMDLGQAGAIIAKGLGGMNLDGKFAGRLADILAYTSGNTNTNIAAIGEAFKVAAPVAASQNVSMEQLSTYIGAMANKGYEGSEAGNAISAAFLRLAKMPEEGQQVLKKLGVGVMTKDGKMRQLPDIMKALSEAMTARNYGEAQQLNVIETLFGKNFGKAMMGFMQASASGDVDKLEAGVYNNSFGRAKAMADINLDTLNGQIDLLKSAWDGVKMTIGDMFSPIVREGVELLSNALSKLNALMKEFPNASKGIATALGSLAIFKAAKSIWNIGSALVQLPSAWLEVARAGKAAGDVMTAAGAAGQTMSGTTTIIGKIGAAFGVLKTAILAHPLLALAALVAAVVVGVIMNWDKVKAWWDEWVLPNVWEPLKNFAGETIDALKQTWENFKQWISNLFSGINPFADWKAPQFDSGLAEAGKSAIKAKNGGSLDMRPAYMRAKGGIISRPELSIIGEAGAEAIIPLTDRSRGVPLLQKAAETLGVVPHADGGIFSTPHVGLVGEAGSEAIIPLERPKKGIPLLMRAAETLGVVPHAEGTRGVPSLMQTAQSFSLTPHSESRSDVMNLARNVNTYSSSSLTQSRPSPTSINLTVNVQGAHTDDEEGLAEKIAAKVREVLADITSLEERVSYA